jgi:hypothetical protein
MGLVCGLWVLSLVACFDKGAQPVSPAAVVARTAPTPLPEDIARWLLSCMRGRTEGKGFEDWEEGRAAMDEALMSCRVFLERFPEGEPARLVHPLYIEARLWLSLLSPTEN